MKTEIMDKFYQAIKDGSMVFVDIVVEGFGSFCNELVLSDVEDREHTIIIEGNGFNYTVSSDHIEYDDMTNEYTLGEGSKYVTIQFA